MKDTLALMEEDIIDAKSRYDNTIKHLDKFKKLIKFLEENEISSDINSEYIEEINQYHHTIKIDF